MCMQCAGNICGLEPCQVKPYFRTVVMVVSGEGGEVIVGGEELVEYFQYLKGWSG